MLLYCHSLTCQRICVRSMECDAGVNESCTNCTCCPGDQQFLEDFKELVPTVFMSVSAASAVSCLLVFITYCSLKRLSGYLPKVLLLRTTLDFFLALVHIASWIADSARNNKVDCKVLGAFIQFILLSSSGWHLMLIVELVLVIRNPFSLGTRIKKRYHFIVWTPALASVVVLVATGKDSSNAGRSMFYFCWVSIEKWETFRIYSMSLFVIPQLLFFLTTLMILTLVVIILCKRLPTSSKIRVQVLKQNICYVFVLTFESMCVGGIWMTQYISVQKNMKLQEGSRPCFCCHRALVLAIAFAVIHSIRGVVDCVTWFFMFSIGPKDCSYLWRRIGICCKKRKWQAPPELTIPLVTPNSTTVDKALRRDIIYCINRGILDVIETMIDKKEECAQLGDVHNEVSAIALVKQLEEEEDNDAEQGFSKNSRFELNTRKIKFSPKSSYGIFSFVSMEPSVFRLLWKNCKLNLDSFKQSFYIHDLKDVDSSGMQEQFSEGKSGSFFYFTHDRRYVIKTVNTEEKQFLCKIAPFYYEYIKDNPDSLIVRLYGLYQVQLAWEQKYISVIVMENIFHSLQRLRIHEKYDLKGSTVKRETGKKSKESAVLKDLDLQNKVCVGRENKAALLEQLRRDTEFLARHHIMDYSLLLGIHDHCQQEENIRRLTATLTIDGFQDVNRRPDSWSDASLSSFTDSQHSREESFIEGCSRFRQDYGGLRSYTPHHPIYDHEVEASANLQFPSSYNGKGFDNLPVATYYIGLVDILQEYNMRKKLEHCWKVTICRADAKGISVVDPEKYRQRFLNFIDKEVLD